MSADNYILIRKENMDWVGYIQAASVTEVTYDTQCFKDRSFLKAIAKAQEMDTEYGYRIENIQAMIDTTWLGL